MTYMRPLGADWCSDQTNATQCKSMPSGICLPTTSAMLEKVKTLQRNINRLISSRKIYGITGPLLAVDGRVGDMTRASAEEAMAAIAGGMRLEYCDNLMDQIDTVSSAIATAVRVTDSPPVPDPVRSRPSTVTSGGKVQHPPVVDSGLSMWWIAALGVGGLLWWKSKKKKR